MKAAKEKIGRKSIDGLDDALFGIFVALFAVSVFDLLNQAYTRTVLAVIGAITLYFFARTKTRKEGEKEQ
jgi:ABC-type phosphate/phosphonate transport system permease subunit